MELNEMLTLARNILKERTDSLLKDVRYCVLRNQGTQDWPAPFPALLYCFSTIDLLGALYGGDAREKQRGNEPRTRVTELARVYMTEMMKYPDEKSKLLQKVFRHKIVHLAQPIPKVEYGGKIYTWYLEHNNRVIHLEIKHKKSNDFLFCVSIYSLAEDIVDSVYKPNGYVHELENTEDLQLKFENAYCHIFI
jgi:hypothetical protein